MGSEEVKAWLERFREEKRNVELLTEQLSQLRATIEAPSPAKLDGMPHGNETRVDIIGRKAVILEKAERELAQARVKAESVWCEISDAISQISCKDWPRLRAVLRFRYLQTLSWTDVCFSLFGSMDDFLDKEESYIRRCHYLHKQALVELGKALEAGAEPDRKQIITK